MDSKLEKILEALETKCDKLGKDYMTMENKKTADYFLTLGKASELGDTIDFIKEHYKK